MPQFVDVGDGATGTKVLAVLYDKTRANFDRTDLDRPFAVVGM